MAVIRPSLLMRWLDSLQILRSPPTALRLKRYIKKQFHGIVYLSSGWCLTVAPLRPPPVTDSENCPRREWHMQRRVLLGMTMTLALAALPVTASAQAAPESAL